MRTCHVLYVLSISSSLGRDFRASKKPENTNKEFVDFRFLLKERRRWKSAGERQRRAECDASEWHKRTISLYNFCQSQSVCGSHERTTHCVSNSMLKHLIVKTRAQHRNEIETIATKTICWSSIVRKYGRITAETMRNWTISFGPVTTM